MFRSESTLAQEAKDLAIEGKRGLDNHVAVCLDNQRRIELRFTSLETKLDKQNDTFDRFKDAQLARLDDIKSNDTKRYIAMMGVMATTVLGVATQIIFHFWK